MNKKGHPGTLIPAHPGNLNAVRHGAYSRRIIEPQAAEIEADLLSDSEPTATERIAVHEVARCIAILDAIDRDLDERGVVDRKGEPRSLLGYRARMSRRLDVWLMKISTTIDRNSARVDEVAPCAAGDHVYELRRIALGHDPASTTQDRMRAMQELSDIEAEWAWHAHRSRINRAGS